ncbi:LysR family transcriptional regulator [Amphritea sp. HPY]|uniref:LysR family transcriptional regulator n=1 Tax=Amphritea sp. HPY TaxID=3421652 RepID=UPI003D7C465C
MFLFYKNTLRVYIALLLIYRIHIVKKLPPLEDIRVFITAARLGSFTATSDLLGVSPAYVSKRIALLEKNLNIRLFLRSARHMSLTLEGKIAFNWGQRMLENMDQMNAEISQDKLIPKGVLRIASSTGFGSQCIAPLVSQLVFEYPELQVDLELLDRPIDPVSEGFDLEIRVGGALPQHLIARKLASNYRLLCAAPDYLKQQGVPQRPDDLVEHHCIGIRERDQGYGLWRLEGPQGVESVKPGTVLSTNNGDVARQWCLNGHGILLRSVWNVEELLHKGVLMHVLPEYRQRADIYAVYPSRLETSAKLRVCVSYLEAQLRGGENILGSAN